MNTPNENLQHLRGILTSFNVDAILVSMKCSFDNYNSDFSDIRLISGFSGSNGRAIISQTKAVLAVDGRYTTQAKKQTDSSIWTIQQYPEATILSMMKQTLNEGETIAVSAMAHSYKSYTDLLKQITSLGFIVKTIDPHPVIKYREKLSENNKILVTETEYIKNRTDFIKQKISNNQVFLLADKETISWIFGLRKAILESDKAPVANTLAIFTQSGKPIVFSDLPIENNSFFEHYVLDKFQDIMNNFKNMIVRASYSHTPAQLICSLMEDGFSVEPITNFQDPFEKIKTQQEISCHKEGARETSAAFIKMLAYVDYHVRKGEKVTEQDAINYFESKEAIDLSFPPICASAENTPIVHYTPSMESNSFIKKDALFLFDAGFHFKNCTTDMTRTIYIGDTPPENLKRTYTIILKSLISYSMCKFPNNVHACALDAICRYHMWQNGMDYEFGTGHGVGSYRSVHEKPHIGRHSKDRITENMVTTVEPGYYTNKYGIRIENMLVSLADQSTDMLKFETITYIPFCCGLIQQDMLDKESITWLNEYHSNVSKMFLPIFKNDPIITSWILRNTKFYK